MPPGATMMMDWAVDTTDLWSRMRMSSAVRVETNPRKIDAATCDASKAARLSVSLLLYVGIASSSALHNSFYNSKCCTKALHIARHDDLSPGWQGVRCPNNSFANWALASVSKPRHGPWTSIDRSTNSRCKNAKKEYEMLTRSLAVAKKPCDCCVGRYQSKAHVLRANIDWKSTVFVPTGSVWPKLSRRKGRPHQPFFLSEN